MLLAAFCAERDWSEHSLVSQIMSQNSTCYTASAMHLTRRMNADLIVKGELESNQSDRHQPHLIGAIIALAILFGGVGSARAQQSRQRHEVIDFVADHTLRSQSTPFPDRWAPWSPHRHVLLVVQ